MTELETNQEIRLWGVGGDLVGILNIAPEISEHVFRTERLRLYDASWGGCRFRGATIRESSALNEPAYDTTPIAPTPLHKDVRASMWSEAKRGGFISRWLDLYDDVES